jgi:amino acid adenylation domain-containing protein
VPLDPGHPAERLALVLGDSAVAVLVTEERWLERLAAATGGGLGARVVCLDREAERIAGEPAAALADPWPAELQQGLAYLLYTSGSTGRPKGVALPHRAVVNFLRAMAERPGLGAGDVVAALTTLTFDIAALEIYLPLAVGGRVEVIGRDEGSDGKRLAARLAASGVTVVQATPATWRLLLESAGWAGASGRAAGLPPGPGLKALCGGEALRPDLASALLAGGCELWNMYGPTETAVWSATARIAAVPAATAEGSALTLGRAIANTALYVVDRGHEPLPVGVAGELWIGGQGVARGYWGRPGLTAERFVPDPWRGRGGERAYRTGDLVRWRPQGDLEFLGRIDHQVKVRGFRIELGEVEAALASHPAVARAVAVADARRGGRLVAYLVPRRQLDLASLRAHLQRKLPDYMIPAAWVELAAVPLTPSGKVDRRALPDPEDQEGAAAGGIRQNVRPAGRSAPRTPEEQLLADIWRELLGCPQVAVEDDFFALGGHSLLATQLVSRVRRAFGVELQLRRVFERPTLEALARELGALAAERPGERGPALGRLPARRERVLSYAQERLWFLAQLEPAGSAYNLSGALRLEGALDAAVLARSLDEIVRRHEVLRSTFPAGFGKPSQVVLPARPLAVPLVDLSPLAAAAAGAGRELGGRLARQPFDLGAGPLVRATLLRLAREEHLLVLALHHIVADGWSIGVFLRELAAFYAAFSAGQPSPLAELPMQYSDFARWQRDWLVGEELETQLAFWRQALEGAPRELALPADRPRPLLPTDRGARVRVLVPSALVAELRRTAWQSGATLFMSLLAALDVLLCRASGQTDLVVGTPIANRERVELEGLIGCFVNVLALRTDLGAGRLRARTFGELLGRVRRASLAAYAHQDLPFEKLIESLAPERNLASTPLFQVMLVLQNTGSGAGVAEGVRVPLLPTLTMERCELEVRSAKFDLTLEAIETPQGLALAFDYSRDLFDEPTVRRLADHFCNLLAALAAPGAGAGGASGAERDLALLPLLGEAERQQLLEWNATAAAWRADRCVHQLIEEQARRTPRAVAVAADDETLTFRALNARANRLARHLRELGVGPETVVAIALEPSAALVVGVLAIWKAGGAWLPQDAGDPAARRRFMQEDSGARRLLDGSTLRGPAPWRRRSGRNLRGAPSGAGPDNLAYVIYASGSTGRPLGVMIPHRGIVNRLLWMQERHRLAADDRVLQATPANLDAAVWELCWPLVCGARLVIAGGGESGGPARVGQAIAEHGITTLHLVPAMLRTCLDGFAQERVSAPAGLRRLLVSGEALDPDLARQAQAAFAAPLFNLYGPAEAAADATWWACDAASRRALAPIGRPLANTRIHLLGPDGEEVPIGVTGEIHIGGAPVGRGYLGRPELTAERFVPDPFAERAGGAAGARLYRTGDLARYLPDGALDFLGRRDGQLKIRGLRVEPAEIEAALAARPEVRAAAVAVLPGRVGERRLAAYVVLAEDGERTATLARLRAALAERLPAVMVPAELVALARLPRTASGALDRQALPSPQQGDGEPAAFVAPRPGLERLTAGIWSAVLGVERVGVHDNFFVLGGHSLLANQVAARLEAALGREVPLRNLFELPTVAGLTAWLTESGAAPAPLPPLAPAARGSTAEISFGQERLWFLAQLEPRSPAYNLPFAVWLTGALDRSALRAAATAVVARHETLRSTFAALPEGDRVMQLIAPVGRVALPLVDLSALPAACGERCALALADAEARRPFDLARGPLLRIRLLRLAPARHLAVFNLHHIVTDAWSNGILIREIAVLYQARRERRPAVLPEIAVQYADFVRWQRRWLAGDVLAREIGWWRERLAGAPRVLELPADRPRPAAQSLRGASMAVAWPAELGARLLALSRRQGATLFMTLLGAFAVLLRRLSGEDRLVVGTPVAGRTRVELEDTIGLFVNTLVLAVDLAGDPSFAEVLGRVRDTALAAFAHQEVPFEKLVAELQPERSLAHSPLFQVMLVLQNAAGPPPALPGLALEPAALDNRTAKVDLSLDLAELDGELRGLLAWSSDLFDEVTVRRWLGHLDVLFTALSTHPQGRIGELPLLSAGESQQLLEWNATAVSPSGPRLLHELIEEQARRAPEAAGEVILWTCDPASARPLAPSGRPASNARVHLLDGWGREVPIGVAGEMYVGGARLARGYLGRPDLTAERFVPDPFAARWGGEPGGRLYRTGELARRLPDGAIDRLGRISDPPEIRGFRGERGEVEAAPAARPGVHTAAVGDAGRRAAMPPLLPRPPGQARGLPLSFAQRRIWFADRVQPGQGVYNLPVAVRLQGALDRAALRRGLRTAVARHEALRTTFPLAAEGGEPVQEITPALTVALPEIDLRPLRARRREGAAGDIARAEAMRTFDLARGPLLRACLLRLDAEEHLLLLTLHHIVADGWSLALLAGELGTLYGAYAGGRPAGLPELPVQYADFTLWQRRWLTDEVLAREVDYWRRQLAGAPALLELPADRPRPPVQSGRGAVVRFTLGGGLGGRLRALGQRRGATLFMTLAAAWKALLARHSGTTDISVGTPIAGRGQRETESIIGLFVNTLVLRTELAGAADFHSLLDRVRETALGAFAHQDLPFEKLVEELQPERSLAHAPLFQVVCALQNVPAPHFALPGLAQLAVAVETRTAKFDLSLIVGEEGEDLRAALELSTDLFDAATVQRLAGHFAALLEGVAAAPARPLAAHPLLGAGEWMQLVREWNDTRREGAERPLAHELVAAQARRRPGALAVAGPAGRLTYGELAAGAHRLACLLRRLGVGPEVPVAVAMEVTPARVLALLAVLEAGGAYVALDPAAPVDRLAFQLDDARAPVLLTEASLLPALPAAAAQVICVDQLGTAAGDEASAGRAPGPAPQPANLAYVIYTSGSTGRPKGVAIPHAGLLNLVEWHLRRYAVDERDRGTLATNPAFDFSVWEMWPVLAAGASLHIPDPDSRFSGAAMCRWWAREGITLASLPTPLAEEAWREAGSGGGGAGLAVRALLVGGDRLLHRPRPGLGFRVVNHYGPTECSVVTTACEVAPAAAAPGAAAGGDEPRLPAIGRPIDNLRVYVLDGGGQAAAVGVAGELCVAGGGLARGYLGRPDLTAERFVPDPWGAGAGEAGGRLYRTGDLARTLPDGRLEFLGRRDHQVKLRGLRIELGEIEAVLGQHPGVREAVVQLAGPAADQRLSAYVVPAGAGPPPPAATPAAGTPLAETAARGSGAPGPAELRRFLEERLPRYMLPADILLLPSLPLTAHGKLDRQALAALGAEERRAGVTAAAAEAAPLTPTQELLAGIWSELLGVAWVGVEENFFALGGHSLLATQLASRVRATLGVELPLRALFENPTVAGLAAEAERRLRGGAAAAPPITRAPRTGPVPLSFAQQRLWFIDQLDPGSAAYNITSAHRASGPLDVAALAASLAALVRRHEILRTVFAAGAGGPVQVIAERAEAGLPVTDLTALPAAARAAEAERLIAEEARRPFDLARGPLLRAALLALARGEHVVLFAFHHIAGDAWSSRVVVAELTTLYEACRQRRRRHGPGGVHGAGGEPAATPAGAEPALAAAPALPALPIQYADYAHWQRQWLSGPVLETELGYWRERLAGAPPVLELPTDRPRPAMQSYRGSGLPWRFAGELSQRLRSLGRREGATPFMVLLAGFMALLSRYSGQRDLSVGTPIAGRNRLETEGLIGFFINTLVLRCDLAGEPGFAALLARVRQAVLEAHAHQDLPFELLVEALQPKRSLSHEPLFQVVTDYHNLPRRSLALSETTWRAIPLRQEAVHFDLILTGQEGGAAEGLAGDAGAAGATAGAGVMGGAGDAAGRTVMGGRLEYRTDLFDRSTALRLVAHLESLLASAAIEEGRAFTELPLLGPAERHQVLVEPGGDLPFDAHCLHRLFEAQARRQPERLAVVAGVEALSYRELDGQANRLAHRLRRAGVGPEVVVGVCLERTPELVVALVAVLKAGGAYLPLDPANPPARLSLLLRDAGAVVAVASPQLRERLPAAGLEVLFPAAAAEPAGDGDDGPVASAVTPENLAYVIYTSGSTGQPRGVQVTHANVSRLLAATREPLGFAARGEPDVWTLFHSYAFDFSVWEMWGALAQGGRLVVVPYWVSRSPEAFYGLLAEEGVTVLSQTPSAFRQLIAAEEAVGPAPGGPLPALRLVIFGGEALDVGSLAPWVARHGAARPLLVNMYGITETTVHVTSRVLAERDVASDRAAAGAAAARDPIASGGSAPGASTPEVTAPAAPGSPIGEALPHLVLRVLGPNLEPQPLGIPGELCVGGAGLARGYLGRPELTAEKFVPDPWATAPGARLYRSGDLARRRAGGEVEYLGRIDHQVKIRGFRIELGEIESALTAQPGVREAVVLVRGEGAQDRRLAAYVVVGGPEGAPEPQALRAELQRRLPEYMVPAAFFVLDALPLTVNGKVDRQALLALDEAPRSADGYVAPEGAVEQILAGVWEEVLGRERVGAHEDFFALGGHSLLATQVVSRLRALFQVELPVRRLFEAPTVAALARAVEEARSEAAGRQGPPIVAAPSEGGHPLSFAQQRLWFLDQLEPGRALYNVPWAARLTGELGAREVALLRRTLAEVVRRHEGLRTRFVSGPEGPLQVVAASFELALPVVCLTALPEARREDEARRLTAAQARRPFDLSASPLARTTLLRLGGAEHLLLATVHHIISDGWSIGILLRELAALYGAFGRGEPSPLPELPIQYSDFARWQRGWLQGEVLAEQLAYWRRQLAGAPVQLELPTDRPRPAVSSRRGGLLPVSLGEELSREVAALCRREGATLFMALTAAFGVLLGRAANQDEVLVGAPIANRNRQEIENLIGFFVNTLVLRVGLGGGPSFAEVLRRVRAGALGAFAHQDLPFERLVDEAAPGRDRRHPPLVQAVLLLQNAPGERLELPGLACRTFEVGTGTAKFDLTLSFTPRDGRLGGSLEYDRDLFDPSTAHRLRVRFETLLEAVVRQPASPASELPLLAPSERHQLLHEWGGSGLAAATPGRAHGETCALDPAQLFEAQVRRAPGAPAVTCEGTTLSYGELNRRANQLARRLRELGVGVDERVGLSVARSLDLVVGVLGILKAGGAYVPIDPGYPRERRAFMAEDAGVRVVVGTEAALADLPAAAAAVLLDAETADLARRPGDDLPAAAGGGDLAYVIYTSGSTGKPKGVLVTRANVGRLFAATRHWFGFDPSDVWTLFHSVAFDFSVWELWGALLHGGRLVVVPYLVSREPDALHALLARERVTVLNQTPSAFAQLMHAAVPLPDLRLVIFGGEALEPVRLAPWFQRHGDARPRLVNMYGITETTVHVTYRPLAADDARAGRGSVIGRAIPDLAAHVLDAFLQPAPIGVAGELCVGGAGVSRGYLGRPELTAERFVPDPFAGQRGQPGARLYRSGDLARYLPSGELEYLGRIDHQVKIRGFRIELEEIQAALTAQAEVREAVVLAREEEGGGRRLIAYVVPAAGAAPAAAELRQRLASRLPEYMVPAAFVLLPALPLTANGKVDRQALLALATSQREESRAYQPPRGEAEAALVEIWEQVLGLDRVGIDDRFFSLGGDSILSLRVRSLAAMRGLHFTLPQLFEHQTVRELACRLAPGGEEAAAASAPFALVSPRDRAALPEGLEDAYPLTALQTGMLFHSGFSDESTLYHNVSSVELGGRFVEAPLRAAIALLLARHPVLRTSFDLSRFGEPLQLVHRQVAPPLAVEDLCGLSAVEQQGRLEAAFAAEQRGKFDRASPPLLRFRVHRLDPERFQFTWAEHHAILDGWSVASMIAELFQLYRRELAAQPAADPGARLAAGLGSDFATHLPAHHAAGLAADPPPLPPPPAASFRDFVALERRVLAGDEGRQFWLRQLAGAPRPSRPVRPAPEGAGEPEGIGEPEGAGGPSPRVVERVSDLGAELTSRLRQLAAALGVPLRSVLLAAHFRVLAASTGQADLVSGLVVNGRPEVRDGERVLGLFLNTLPLRLPPAPGSWLDLIHQTAAAEQALVPFRRYPMAEVQRLLGGGPLFDSAFNFTHFHVLRAIEAGDLRVLGVRAVADVELPLSISFALDAASSRLTLNLQFDRRAFEPWQSEKIAACFQHVLGAMVAAPGQRHEADALLAPAERHQLLVEWNDTRAACPRLPLHEIFDLQAAARPEAPALLAQGAMLTYGELRRRANQLAHRLRALGAGPEVRVGLLLERSPDLIVGLLAILKAGAAYVPLDPEYPPERLAYILEDSAARLLVTRAALARGVAAEGLVRVEIDREPDAAAIAAASRADPASGAGAGHLAYVIYTSGSTGMPKGVLVQHGSAVNYVLDSALAYGVTPADRGLQFTSINFDVSVEEIFTMLLRGGSLALRDEEMLGSPRRFLAAVGELGVTVLTLPTAYWHELAAALADPELALPACLRVVDIGGEKARPEHVARWLGRAFSGVELINAYGPTEATIACTRIRLSSPGGPAGAARRRQPVSWRTPGREVPIGRPTANGRAYVLGPGLLPVPAGALGVLYIGGDGLARGYHGRPELTAESFVPDPHGGRPGARMYRTGDLAVQLPDGNLEFRGRADEQLKIRGFRVEPGEIEMALARHPAMRQAVVAVREDAGGQSFLAAYVVTGERRPEGAELTRFLREQLPAHMVPAAFVFLDRLPLNANGKVDRAALPAPEHGRDELDRDYLSPRDALELQLVGLWEELLASSPIGVRDDFFALGGHSLLAVQLMARIQTRFGRSLPIAALVRHPTVERLGALLRDGAEPAGRGGRAGMVPVRRSALVEMTSSRGAAHGESRAGGGRPFFCVHPIGGEVLCYVHLARHLAPGRAVFALQVPDPDGEAAWTTLEEMAAHYLRCAREVQPAGPYSLGGWSMGGVVAFEMARQLERVGESVDLLALIDAAAPGDVEPGDVEPGEGSAGGDEGSGAGRIERSGGGDEGSGAGPRRVAEPPAAQRASGALVGFFAADLARQLGIDLPAAPEGLGQLGAGEALDRLRDAAERLGLLPPGLAGDDFARRYAIFAANHRRLERYAGGTCEAPVTLFRAARAAGTGAAHDRRQPDLGWGRLARRPVEVREIPGDHYTLLQEPQVGVLAALLRERFAGPAAESGG